MRFYLAARYSRQGEMRVVRDMLTDRGHTVTSRWIDGTHDDKPREDCAIEDMEDLSKSDVILSFTEDHEESKKKRPGKGGRHVEFGMGLAFNKRMLVVGPRENVFHCLPTIEVFDTIEALTEYIDKELTDA